MKRMPKAIQKHFLIQGVVSTISYEAARELETRLTSLVEHALAEGLLTDERGHAKLYPILPLPYALAFLGEDDDDPYEPLPELEPDEW